MGEQCEICRGRRVIDLPVYRPVDTSAVSVPHRVDSAYRTFGCPECGPWAETDRLAVLTLHYAVAVRLSSAPGYEDAWKRDAAARLGVGMLEAGHIRFRQDGPDDEVRGVRRVIATVGVVAAQVVATFEERVKAKSLGLADEVIAAAIREVRNWGSYYRRPEISKDKAAELMESARRDVTGKYRGEP